MSYGSQPDYLDNNDIYKLENNLESNGGEQSWLTEQMSDGEDEGPLSSTDWRVGAAWSTAGSVDDHSPSEEGAEDSDRGYLEEDGLDSYQTDLYQADPRQTASSHIAADLQAANVVLDLDPRFQDAIAKMQAGVWPEVLTLLYGLQADYPQIPLLNSLINEAELKASLVSEWDDKIKGRRFSLRQQYWLRKLMPYMLIFILFVGGWAFYQSFIAPSRQVVAMTRASESMVEEAQGLVRNGRYDEAINLYDQILIAQPDNAAAQSGRADALKLSKHGSHYRMAQEIAEAGNYERALSFLRAIQAESPNFRDVESKIADYEGLIGAQGIFDQAEEAYRNQHWLDALDLYTQAQKIDNDYQRDVLNVRIPEIYLNAGLMLLRQRPQGSGALAQAREYLRMGTTFDHVAATAGVTQIDAYEEGVRARENSDMNVTISRWRSLYDQAPNFLGGLLAEQLYYIYLVHGTDAAERGDYTYAASLFEEATRLQVPDTSEAEKRLHIVSQAWVAPTPGPTAQPRKPATMA